MIYFIAKISTNFLTFTFSNFRLDIVLIVSAVSTYAIFPVFIGFSELPTQISINGKDDWTFPNYQIIYGLQLIYCFYGIGAMIAFDCVFIQCVMQFTYRFQTLSDLLSLLRETDQPRNSKKDKQILVDIYKMHLDVQE